MRLKFSVPSKARCFGMIALSGAACGDNNGGAEVSASAAPESSGSDDSGSEGEPLECEVRECEPETELANDAPPIEACPGGSVDDLAATSIPGLPFPQPGPVTGTVDAIGHWSAVVADQKHLAIHSIHRPTGKFLQFGMDHEKVYYNQDKFVWFPPEPCSPYDVGVTNCDLQFEWDPPDTSDHIEAPNPGVDLFCSGHVNVPPLHELEREKPHTVTLGGQPSFGENTGINESWRFSEQITASDAPMVDITSDWSNIDNDGEERWYPTLTVLADGRVLASGGSTNQSVRCRLNGAAPDSDFLTGTDCSCELDSEGECPAVGCRLANSLANFDTNPPTVPCVCNYSDSVADKATAGFSHCSQLLSKTETVEVMARDQMGEYSWSQLETGVPEQFSLLYPFAFVLPDLQAFIAHGTHLGGKVFMAGAEATDAPFASNFIDPASASPQYQDVGCMSCTVGSSAVMYEPGKIMKFGGGGQPSRMTEVIDFTAALPQWSRVGSTSVGRHYSSGVILPDGTVLATGGSMYSDEGNKRPDVAVTTTDLFDPTSKTWCRLADIPSPGGSALPTYRGYHSQSFLLPDGRVYLGAGGYSDVDHFDHQFFSPPYLFKGPRPEISTGIADPDRLEISTGAEETFTLQHLNAVEISKITMIKLSSSTHNWDMEQRFLDLPFNVVTDPTTGEPTTEGEEPTVLTVTAPLSTCYATPGPYMVFAISPLGVPSIGQYVFVRGTCAAADVPAEPPPDSQGLDFVNAPGNDGLGVACDGAASPVSLATFGHDADFLCRAFGLCLGNEVITFSARLVSSDSTSVPPGGVLLDSGEVEFVDSISTINDDLVLMTSGSTWSSPNIDLGPGRNVVELCATFQTENVCREQVIHVGASLFGPDSAGHRAAEIEARYMPLARILGARRVPLANDAVAHVPLPAGFSFPFHGTQYHSLWIGANGGIRVTSGAIPAANGTGMPVASTGASPHIAAFWDALDVEGAGAVYTHFRGDRFIISWEGVGHAQVPSSQGFSFQIHLFGDGRIEFHYKNTDVDNSLYDHGASATIGVQNPAQNAGLLLSANNSTLLSNGRAFAVELAGCVASKMRTDDGFPCIPHLSGPEVAQASVCGDSALAVAIPELPDLCRSAPEAFVQGSYETSTEPRVFHAERIALPSGQREVSWTVQRPVSLPEGPTYQTVSSEFTQILEIQESRDAALCCATHQTAYTLTSSGDTAAYSVVAAVCVDALDGADYVTSGSAADTLIGGDGADELSAGDGDDRVFGGADNDELYGASGADILHGDDGDDHIEGGTGMDRIFGSSGNDQVLGNDDRDILYPGSGVDSVSGGDGDDDIVLLHACEVGNGKSLDGGPGTDRLLLPPGLTLTDLTLAGVSVTGIESVVTLDTLTVGVSDCDPQYGNLAVPL